MTTPTHRCVNCKREWQETQLEVWQGFPVQQRCPECKSACAKMDPVPTTPPEDEQRWAELAEKTVQSSDNAWEKYANKQYARSFSNEYVLAQAVKSLLTRLAAAREGGR